MSKAEMAVNQFTVVVGEGYPYWTEISHHGKQIARIHHAEMKDLEYALARCRQELRGKMPDNEKHEA